MTKRELMIFVTGLGMGMRAPLKGAEVWGQFGSALGLTAEDSPQLLEVLVECEEVLFADGTIAPIDNIRERRQ